MSVLRFFSAAKAWSHGEFYEPWEAGPSIFEHLSDNPEGGSERRLPDEEKLFKPDKIRFAAGALDSLMGGASEDSLKQAAKHYGMIQKVVSWPSKANIAKLYAALLSEGGISTVDQLSDMV